MRNLIWISVVLVFAACQKTNYEATKVENYIEITNTVKHPKTKVLKQQDIIQAKGGNLAFYFASDEQTGKIIYSTWTNIGVDLYLLNSDGEMENELPLTAGKGPGEFSFPIGGVYFNNGDLYILDLHQKKLEIYDNELKHKDTVNINETIRLYRNPTGFFVNNDAIMITPTIPYVAVKINMEGNLSGSIKSELNESKREELIKMFGHHASVSAVDKDNNLYLVFTDRSKEYKIEKYNSDLNLLWTNNIIDEYLDILSVKRIKTSTGSVQPSRASVANSVAVDDNNIYVLRGVGGYRIWDGDTPHRDVIPGLKNGFIDAFDKECGKYLYRIQVPFLRTDGRYVMVLFSNTFTFFSIPKFDEDKHSDDTANCIIQAKLK